MLAESVEFLQKFSTGRGSGRNHSIYGCRTILSRLVENSLTDFNTVPVSLKKNGDNSDCFTPLQFCKVFLSREPEIFVTSPGSSSPSTPPITEASNGEASEKDQLTRAFLRWFISRIVAVLGQTQCEELHSRCREILHQILEIVKWKDHLLYLSILTEFISCLADLIQINVKLYDEGYSNVKLKHFEVEMDQVLKSLHDPARTSDVADISLSPAFLDINDVNNCDILQLNITKILGQVCVDISQFCVQSVRDPLWATLSCHLEYGNLDLKTVSLTMMSTLMRLNGQPSVTELMDYFVSCMMGLLDFLCAGCPGQEDSSATVALETATATLLNHLTKDGGATLVSKAQLQMMMFKMVPPLRKYGLSKLETLDMKRSVSCVIYHLLDQLPVSVQTSSLLQPPRRQLLEALVNEAGCRGQHQYMVKVLVKSISQELCQPDQHQTADPQQRSQAVGKAGASGPNKPPATVKSSLTKRKRKLEDTQSGSSLPASKTWKMLTRKLTAITSQTAFPEGVDGTLEGVRVLVEVMVTCVATYSSKKSQSTCTRVLSELRQLDTWLNPQLRQTVVTFMAATLQYSVSVEDKSRVNTALVSVVQTVGALLAVQDCAEIDQDTYQAFTWMASLPWLLNDPSWMDLKPVNSRDILKLAGDLTDHFDSSTISEGLLVLALLPKEVCPKWRAHVFRQALGDTDARIKMAALKAFPFLLYQLGPNANHQVYDLIHPCMSETTAEIPRALAEMVGPLACIISRKAVLNRSDDICLKNPIYKELAIACTFCDLLHEDVSGSPRERPRLVDPNMFLPFLQLVNSSIEDVKLELITSMKRLFGHIGVRKNNAASIRVLNMALALIEDRKPNVRKAFSRVIQYLLGDEDKETSDGTYELVFCKLREVFTTAQMKNNSRLQETVLLTIAQLGRVAEDDMLVVVVIVLLESMLSPTPLVAAVAYRELKEIVAHKKTLTQNLFMHCRQDICKFLVDTLHDAQTQRSGKTAEDILIEVARVLDFPDVKTFLTGTEMFIVPYLVSKSTPVASNLIKMIATHLSVPSRKKLMINNAKFVFSHLVRFCQREADLQSAITFLQKETDFELRDLLLIDFQRVHNELLQHLSTHYTQVFNGLKILSSYDRLYKDISISTTEEMATYLQPRLLGFLVNFDSQLARTNVPMEEKRPLLESLISLIRLMGPKHINAIRHKIMNTLRIGLQFVDSKFIEILCRAWNCFIRSLEVPLLGLMLPQVVATLIPLLKQQPKQVADIFNYIILENKEELKDHFQEIYFLPDLPELKDAKAVLKECTEGTLSASDFKSRLELTIRGVTHESLDVRLYALSKLKKLLREERESLFQCVVGSETADPLVSKLISVLLNGCREADKRAQGLYTECLGRCSAIDPGRLEFSSSHPRTGPTKVISVMDDNYAIGLINEMVKFYLAATEPKTQDCAAFALQELLSIYHICEATEGKPRGGPLWKRFPEPVQEVLVPLLSSKYMLKLSTDWSNLQKPIYTSRLVKEFKDWITNWTGYLLSQVKQEKPHQVFNACRPVIKTDIHLSLYILPNIVLYILMDCSIQLVKEICEEILVVLNQVKKHNTSFHHMAAQTIFSVLDFLEKWKRLRPQIRAMEAAKDKASTSSSSSTSDREYENVSNFLTQIPQDLVAEVSYSCQAFTRALMHFEQFIHGQTQYQQEHLDFMQRLYVAMDEPDGVLGIAAIRQSSPTLMEQILTYGKLGQQHEMQACYEQAIQLEPDDINHHQGLLRSILDLGQPSKALHHATGVIAERKEWSPLLNAYQVEAAWKLGDWSKLKSFTSTDKGSRNWSVVLGKILLAAKDQHQDQFFKQLQVARQEQIGPLSAASMEIGSYQRSYEHIVRLHMLNEIEENMMTFMKMWPPDNQDESEVQQISRVDLLKHRQTMLGMMQSSFRIQEPVLTLRRILLALAQEAGETTFDRDIGQCWLWSAKLARKAGYLQTAYSSLLQASEFHLPEFCIEKAKWLWEKGVNDQALALLEREMQAHFGDVAQLKLDCSAEGKSRRKVYAQILLLYGRYSEETSNLESNAIVKQYKEVIEVNPEWEDGHFYLAKYFDKIMTTLVEDKDRPDISRQGEFVIHVVKNFGQSLHYGNQFIYQSLPRMLSLWLDFGTAVVDCEKKDKSRPSQNPQGLQKLRMTLAKLNKMINDFGRKLPPYLLLTAFSQLMSRLCHAQPDVFLQLKTIIARLVGSYPQQSLWLLIAVSKSSYKMRENRCKEILAAIVDMKPNLQKLIQDFVKLTERLLELCEKDYPTVLTLSMNQHFRQLKRLLDDSHFSEILLPLQSLMTVTLPNTTDSLTGHNPFQENPIYIKGFEDTIEMLPSLQRPKKITMVGSDGNLYVMMCKPKDDLRKDCRLMEFNGIINKFLRKDPESRRRQLRIRTYTVIPLNEECGLLEWVNNTSGLRHILMKLYKEKGIHTTGKELKALMPSLQASIDTKLQIFKQKLMPKHPPVFAEWFLRTFPDPTSWYNARLAYARTVAVMSVVGYILGLGDRHGENILFDSTCGDCVHVDFNCLFNRGETFEWPEKVPFRLTHNLVTAMGPLKLEGIFRRACEVTLRVMRNQIDPLMSVLRPFVYDPLVEWSKTSRGQKSNPTDSVDITNEQAMTHVQNIEHRLKGILKNKTKPRGLALSVEGHVNYLIQEATDEKNLCQMYIGWAAYF